MNERGRKFQEERSWHDWYSALVHTRRRFAPRAAASRLSDYPLRFACVCDTIPQLTPDEYSAAIASLSAQKDSAEYKNARERLITYHLREILAMATGRPHYRLPAADYDGKRQKRVTPLGGLVWCGCCGGPMKENFSLRGGTRRYRYFVCGGDAKRLRSTCPLRHVPAPELERLVVNEIGSLLGTPETLAGVLDEAKGMGVAALTTEKLREALADLVSVWDVMFPVERYRLVRGIVARITVWPDKVRIRFNPAGLEETADEGVQETARWRT